MIPAFLKLTEGRMGDRVIVPPHRVADSLSSLIHVSVPLLGVVEEFSKARGLIASRTGQGVGFAEQS